MVNTVEKMIANTFLTMAKGLESGSFGERPKIAVTGMGSEHGEENVMEAAKKAAKAGIDVYYIGSLSAEGVNTVFVADDEEGHKKMESMLENGEVDGARQTEKALKKMVEGGYELHFAQSSRADGGCVMRGNDILQASADVMVMDSLTGNVMSKMLSSFTTGGSFEATGYGYGPGIGENYNKLVMIVSRASGAPVIYNAICYAAELVKGKVFEVARV